ILHQEPPELSSIDSGIPKALESVVSKCLAKKAEHRYQTIEQVARDLNGARDGELAAIATTEIADAVIRNAASTDVVKARPTSSVEYIVGEIKRHRLSASFALAAVILIVTTIVYFAYFANRAAGDAIDSVAVLPFVNVDNDPNKEY